MSNVEHRMMKYFLILFLGTWLGAQPCTDYACDSLAVRAILDANGMFSTTVEEVTDTAGGRIIELDINSNSIADSFYNLTSDVGKLTSLKKLKLFNNNNLVSIPVEIGLLSQLDSLFLIGNKINELPDEIGNLANLRYLNIRDNNLSHLPVTLGNIISIITISAQNNVLTSIPNEIGFLDKLEYLDLTNNKISTLPSGLGNCDSLKYLYLGQNEIKDISSFIGGLSGLIDLRLESNQLISIPSDICNLNSLDLFFLGNNNMSSLPECIGSMNEISMLSISYNNFDSIPDCIYLMENLGILSVSGNKISLLKTEIGNMVSLGGLSLDHNQLEDLPVEILGLSCETGIGYNRLCNLPDSIEVWLDKNAVSHQEYVFCSKIKQYCWKDVPWRNTQECDSITIENTPEITESEISVYPNPFNPTVTISIPNTHTDKGLIQIYDIRGKIVFQKSEVRGQKTVWDAAGLGAGIYVLKARIGNKKYSRKLILQK